MDTTVLRTLEFDRIREALARETLTPLGQARARQLDPSSDPVEVQHQLDATGQAVAWLDDGETLSITAPDDLLDLLEQLRLGGQPLEPHGLVSLATFVESVDAVCAAVRRGSGATPLLADIAEAAASFVAEAAATRRALGHPAHSSH